MIMALIWLMIAIAMVAVPMFLSLVAYVFFCSSNHKVLSACHDKPAECYAARGAGALLMEIGRKLYGGDYMKQKEGAAQREANGVYLNEVECGLHRFIRVCYYVGCEVVIRPRTATPTDTEKDPKETRKKLAALYEKRKDMKQLFK